MPRFAHSQHSFNGGELSPEVQGRRDIDKYGTGASLVENFIITPEGGMHRRSGTRFVGESENVNNRSRLRDFVASDGSSYILEFSGNLIQVYKGTSKVEHVATTLDYTAVDTTTDEITLTDHGFTHQQGPFELTGAGIPAGLASSTDYFIQLPETATGDQSAIDTGTNTLTSTGDPHWEDEMGPYRFSTDGNMPGGLNAFTDYYLLSTTATTTQLSTTPGGAAVNITNTGGATDTWTLRPTQDYMRDKFRLTTSGFGFPAADITAAGTGSGTIAASSDAIPVTVRTDYVQSDIPNLKFGQSSDALYIAHSDHRPAQLTRVSDTQWAWDYVALVDGPYLDVNTDSAATITTTSHSLGSRCTVTLTTAAKSYVNDGAGFQASTDIGRIMRWNGTSGSNDAPGYIEIDDVESDTVARGTVLQTIAGSPGSTYYRVRMGAWYTGNYPKAVAIAEQRLCFGGEPSHPNFVTTSNTGLLNVFRPTEVTDEQDVLATNSVRVGLYDNRIQRIQWLSVGRTLEAGTDSAVFALRGTLDGESFGPTNINAIKVSSIGCSSVAPVNVYRHTVYVSRNSQGMRGLEGDDGSDSRVEQAPIDLALLSRHVFDRTESVEELAYQFDRRSIVWAVRSDGILLGCTYVPEQDVYAWHRHRIGGDFSGGHAVVESVAVDSNTGGSFDRVWLVVRRDVGRYVEYFEDEWLDGATTSQSFVDSHPEPYSGSAVSTFDTYGHLIGEVVQVLGTGAVLPDATISNQGGGVGRLSTAESHTDVVAGYGYTSTFESLPLEFSDEEGTSLGKMARLDHVVLRLWNSSAGEVGVVGFDGSVNADRWSHVVDRGALDVHGSPPAPFTGDIKVALDGANERRTQIQIRQTQPVGFNVLSMSVMGNSGQR